MNDLAQKFPSAEQFLKDELQAQVSRLILTKTYGTIRDTLRAEGVANVTKVAAKLTLAIKEAVMEGLK